MTWNMQLITYSFICETSEWESERTDANRKKKVFMCKATSDKLMSTPLISYWLLATMWDNLHIFVYCWLSKNIPYFSGKWCKEKLGSSKYLRDKILNYCIILYIAKTILLWFFCFCSKDINIRKKANLLMLNYTGEIPHWWGLIHLPLKHAI